MPDVRRACAAQAPARTAPRLHRTSSRPTHLPRGARPRVTHPPRHPPASSASRPRPFQFPPPAQRRGPTPGTATAARSRLTVHPAPSPFRSFGRSVFSAPQRRSIRLPEATRASQCPASHRPWPPVPFRLISAPAKPPRDPSLVLRRSPSSSRRPAVIRARLTPACSGLATLATDARR